MQIAKRYRDLRFLYLAFNRSVAKEARQKFPRNTNIRTVHSLAYGSVRGLVDLSDIRKLKPIDLVSEYGIRDYAFSKLAVEVFRKFCYSDKRKMDVSFVREVIRKDEHLRAIAMVYKVMGT